MRQSAKKPYSTKGALFTHKGTRTKGWIIFEYSPSYAAHSTFHPFPLSLSLSPDFFKFVRVEGGKEGRAGM